MRLSTSYHLLAFLGFVAVSVSADPLSDISHTSVDLGAGRQSLRSDSPRFSLIVHRTDDLVDENAGTLVAERQVEIQMDFDVTATGEDNSLLLNGVPVQAGISGVQVQVEAEMMINRARIIKPDGTIDHEKEEGVESAFDVGLVTVEVFVRAATMDVQLDAFLPPVPIRRFSLMERVIEINGQSVVQTDIGEQVFYFGPGGEFIGLIEDAEWSDVTQGEESSILASQPVKSPSMDCRMARIRTSFKSWFNGLPFALKFLIGFAWAAVGVLWGLFLTSRIALLIRRARSGYKSVDVENTAETLSKDYSDDVKEMELDVETCEGLPKYGSENEEKAPAALSNSFIVTSNTRFPMPSQS